MSNKSIWLSLKYYWKKKWREGISHVITGQGSAFLLMHIVHNIEFFKHNGAIQIIVFILIGLVPVTVDFMAFHKNHPEMSARVHALGSIVTNLSKKGQNSVIEIIDNNLKDEIEFFKKINEKQLNRFEAENYLRFRKKSKAIEHVIFDVFKKENQLMVSAMLSTLNKELNVITEISKNKLERRVLHHFDYLREALGRILVEVMKKGDHYITLASLDFWTIKPFDPEDFLNVNLRAVYSAGMQISRVMIIEKKFLTGEGLTENDLVKFHDFVQLIEKIKDAGHDLKYNYKERFKMFFHFHYNFRNIRNFLDSIIVLNSKLDELMFIKVQRLSGIANNRNDQLPENPNIQTNFFELPQTSTFTEIEPHDIIRTLNHIKGCVEKRIDADKDNKLENEIEYKALLELKSYLNHFTYFFDKIGAVYNLQGFKKNEITGSETCDFFDVEMMHQHYNTLRISKPELFASRN